MSPVEIIHNFEGASLGESQIQANAIFASIHEEPLVKKDGILHDYNWHFVFGVKNNSNTEKQIKIFINCKSKEQLDTRANILGTHKLDSEFHPLDNIDAYTDTYKKYAIEISLSGKETCYLSNTYFRNLNLIKKRIESLDTQNSFIKENYGKSLEGRELEAYLFAEKDISQNQKPNIVVTSGFHPMEGDTLATEALMEFLGTEEGTDLLNRFNFIIIPVVNPDGFAHGFNGCNAKGINLYWDFREKDKKNAPEAFYLWAFLNKIPPSVYIDFHAYTFQLHRKKASSYIKPTYLYRGTEVRDVVEFINRELISYHDGHFMEGPLTFTPSALPYKLTDKFNTLTYAKYHLHIKDGKDALKKSAVDIVKKITYNLISHDFCDQGKILSVPYGNVRGNIRDYFKKKINVFWTFRLKVFLKKILGK